MKKNYLLLILSIFSSVNFANAAKYYMRYMNFDEKPTPLDEKPTPLVVKFSGAGTSTVTKVFKVTADRAAFDVNIPVGKISVRLDAPRSQVKEASLGVATGNTQDMLLDVGYVSKNFYFLPPVKTSQGIQMCCSPYCCDSKTETCKYSCDQVCNKSLNCDKNINTCSKIDLEMLKLLNEKNWGGKMFDKSLSQNPVCRTEYQNKNIEQEAKVSAKPLDSNISEWNKLDK